MQLVVFEDAGYVNHLPLVYPRATFNLRCGCDNLLSKIETAFGRTADAIFVRNELAVVMDERQRQQYPQPRPVNRCPDGDDQLWINGRLLVRQRFELAPNSAAWQHDAGDPAEQGSQKKPIPTLLAARLDRRTAGSLTPETLLDPGRLHAALSALPEKTLPDGGVQLLDYPWQIIHANEAEIVRQAGRLERKRLGRVYPGAHLIDESSIHIGAGSRIKPGAVLDAEAGPIVIADNATISPNVTITGPAFIGDGCLIQPGASIRGGTSLGPVCKVGGEVEGAIIHAYSNKQHDGFLGHSYVGEWVNLGADTVNSDLKNTYGSVRVALNGREVDTGQMFVGAFIGDHTKTGIRVALPTGCVIGYACNVLVSRYAPRFVPSFTWLTDQGAEPYDPEKAVTVARAVMKRRNRLLTPREEELFRLIASQSQRIETRS